MRDLGRRAVLPADEALDALVGAGEAVPVHQVLPDAHGVAARLPSSSSMMVRNGSQKLAATGAESAAKSVVTSLAGFAGRADGAGVESVVTPLAEFAGAGGFLPHPRGGRSTKPAAFR